MLINEIMSKDVVCADPDEKLASIAKKMKDRDIGSLTNLIPRDVILS